MSDPVTNVEIEDVLSSIRRLVSQDGTGRDGRQAASDPADALVLTEDHRVDETGAQEPTGLGDMRQRAAKTVRSELEKAIEELEATMGIAPDPASEPVSDAVAEPSPPANDVTQAVDAVLANVAERREAIAGEVAQSLSHQEPEAAALQPDTSPESFGPEGEDEADSNEIDWDAPVGQAMAGAPPISHLDAGLEDTAPEEPEEAFVASEAVEVDVPDAEASVLKAIKIVSDAADEGGQDYDEQYEGDILKDAQLDIVGDDDASEAGVEEEDQDFRGSEPVFQTSVEAASVAPLATAAVDPDYSEVAIDEEMLRDMVAQIVRSELQGELGERITRNVRKLVRREINRALAGQDLI